MAVRRFMCMRTSRTFRHEVANHAQNPNLGAAGCVLQSRAVTDFIAVIEHVLVGNNYILPDVSGYGLPPKHR